MPLRLTPSITLYTRIDWGARTPTKHMGGNFPIEEAFLHHSTDRLAEHADTLAEQKAIARAIQRFHMDTRGWADIGYHFLVFQPYGHRKYARIFQGRLLHNTPAAQLNYNRHTLAVCVIGNFDRDDALKENTRHAIRVLLNHVDDGTAIDLATLGGHRDVTATDCPGDTLYRAIPTIAKAAGLKVYKP